MDQFYGLLANGSLRRQDRNRDLRIARHEAGRPHFKGRAVVEQYLVYDVDVGQADSGMFAMDLLAAVPECCDEGRCIVGGVAHGVLEIAYRPAFVGAPAGAAIELRLEELEDFPTGLGLRRDSVDERVEGIYALLIQFAWRSETPFCRHVKTHGRDLQGKLTSGGSAGMIMRETDERLQCSRQIAAARIIGGKRRQRRRSIFQDPYQVVDD